MASFNRVDDHFNAADFTLPRWYVVCVRSNQEKQVAAYLTGLRMEHYVPCCTSLRQWKDRRVKLEMPLFPGYLFVRLPLQEQMKVLTIRQVVSLVGRKNSPSPISDEEIAGISAGVEHGNAQPPEYLEAGPRSVINHSALCGDLATA